MEADEVANPIKISFLGFQGVMASSKFSSHCLMKGDGLDMAKSLWSVFLYSSIDSEENANRRSFEYSAK